jgi:hypothetical protein
MQAFFMLLSDTGHDDAAFLDWWCLVTWLACLLSCHIAEHLSREYFASCYFEDNGSHWPCVIRVLLLVECDFALGQFSDPSPFTTSQRPSDRARGETGRRVS